MNRITRRSMALGAPAAAVLAACVPGQQTGGTQSEEPVELFYMHQWSQTTGQGPKTRELTERFVQENPKIQVRQEYSEGYFEKLNSMIVAGDPPDIATTNYELLLDFVKKGGPVQPESVGKGQYRFPKDDVIAPALDAVTFDGKAMAMPYMVTNLQLAYNQTLFAQRGLNTSRPPATWAEVEEMGRQLTGGEGESAVWGFQTLRGQNSAIWVKWLCTLWQADGQVVDMNRRVPVFNSQAGVDALQWWVDLIHLHRIASLDQAPAAFQNGRAGMFYLYAGELSAIDRVNPPFQWATAPLPRGKKAATNLGGHALMTMKAGEHPEQAWRYVHWFTSPAQHAEYSIAAGTLPATKSSQQHAVWQKRLQDYPRLKAFSDNTGTGVPPAKLSTWSDILKAIGGAMESAVTLKQAPKAALDDAARIAEPLVKQG